MNKVKDFLYDISDLVFSLLIIAVIFFIVSLKLSDTMKTDWYLTMDDNSMEAIGDDSNLDESTLPLIDEVTDTDDEDVVTEVTEVVEETSETIEITEVITVEFVVTPGSISRKIAKDLLNQSLIDDVDDFIKTLGDLGLDRKLGAGTFKLNTGMTYTDIIYKLTGR